MGSACGRALAREGARVALCDSDVEGVRRTAKTLTDASAFELDVRNTANMEAALEAIEAKLGGIDHLVVASGTFDASPMLETPQERWSEIFAVNVFGAVALLRLVAQPMRDRGRGSIVVIASQSAKVVRIRQSAYGASKAALTYAAKALGLELAQHGVRVNVVHPGVTDTPMAQRVWEEGKGSERAHIQGSLENYRPPIPLGRVAHAENVADAVLFLLSEQAAHITMSELVVDGGATYIA
jgi:2,3-dihydro-2,3-dihydroxybenzoate dehydrogenase